MTKDALEHEPFTQDHDMYLTARQHLVGGVGATTRFCSALGHPLYISSANGHQIVTVSGRTLVDVSMSNGVLPYGHNHPAITKRVLNAITSGIRPSFDSDASVEFASQICNALPGMDMCRYALSGTEATMHALRIARAATSRDVILKCHGHFHGYHDYLQFNWFTEYRPNSLQPYLAEPHPESSGIPTEIADLVLNVSFNDLDALEEVYKNYGNRIAAFILEPIAINAGCIPPTTGYLSAARSLCDTYGSLLIFDEILSGFRTSIGCAQRDFAVKPDLCTLGKVIGGGFPLSVVAGRRDVMSTLNPVGPVTFSGTFPGGPVTMEAALSALKVISSAGFYSELHDLTRQLTSGLRRIFRDAGIIARVQEYGDRFSILFGLDPDAQCCSLTDSLKCQRTTLREFCRGALHSGVFLRECNHHGISTAHAKDDVEDVLDRLESAVSYVSLRSVQQSEVTGNLV